MTAEPEDLDTLRKRIEAIEDGTYQRDAKPEAEPTARRVALKRNSTLRRSPLQRKTPLRCGANKRS